MNQLTIFAGVDLEQRVLEALDGAGVCSFLRVPGATGHRFLPGDEVPRALAWDAVLFLVPVVDTEQLQGITDTLTEAAAGCEVEPCIRIVATPVRVLL